jgi:hypothetical protein
MGLNIDSMVAAVKPHCGNIILVSLKRPIALLGAIYIRRDE